ncbi:MAG: phenylalanine--tRNA ligase subunit beta [Elusimicrobiota bacterium]|jgi:phenylalanyl-tRNA synthetase beta chain|nr:phenylalanine--tRNA ligase subunit beta [Elusimicrobiota bacterium]
MKILYSWLKDYLDISLSPAELEKHFTTLGMEVAQITKSGADFDGVFAARIEKIEQHPNADKLSLVTLKTAQGEQRVVCGAKNLVLGDKIALAKVGARLGSVVLKPAEIRGVVSEGMICSADELGLANTRQKGIMVLDKDIEIGAEIKTLYGKADVIFDLEITSNRPDLLSHKGVARELSILLNLPLKQQDYKPQKGNGQTLKINLPAGELGCPRYIGRTIKNVKNTASPKWMQERLLAMGANPKNALVDITNYVLYDIGHPLHAFDLNQLESGEINVRWAQDGESFLGLDGVERTLNTQNLVIADGKKPVALAGVLGGKADSIGDDTQNIFLEAAYFAPTAINKTAKQLGISTEASQRFERGADIEACDAAMDLATKLITEICGGEVSQTNDVYPVKYQPAAIVFEPEQINKILGIEIPKETLKEIFTKMSPSFAAESDKWAFTPPSYRRDITQRWDLAEEVIKFYGFDKLAQDNSGVSHASLYFGENPKNVDLGEIFANTLTSLGFLEAKNFDFVSLKDINALGFKLENTVEIKNPLAEGMEYMRPALLPSLLKNIEYNQHQSRHDLALFEYSKVFALQKGYPSEFFSLGGVICGKTPRSKFFMAEQKPVDFYFVKGIVENILAGYNIKLMPSVLAPVYMHPKICMDILLDGKAIGVLGKVHPLSAKLYGIKTDVYAFEFSTKNIEKYFDVQTFKKAKDISVYPSSTRDLSLVLDDSATFSQVEAAILEIGQGVKFALIDLYQGKNLPEGKKSITLRFEFSSNEKTLTDKEINLAIETILKTLTQKLNATLR